MKAVGYGLPELGPTLWVPVVGGRATLVGLPPGTPYRAWIGDGTLNLTTQPVPDT